MTIGDEIRCINNKGVRNWIKEGGIYVVNNIIEGHCEKMPWLVDVGIPSTITENNTTQCVCGEMQMIPSRTHWFRIDRFVEYESLDKQEYKKLIQSYL